MSGCSLSNDASFQTCISQVDPEQISDLQWIKNSQGQCNLSLGGQGVYVSGNPCNTLQTCLNSAQPMGGYQQPCANPPAYSSVPQPPPKRENYNVSCCNTNPYLSLGKTWGNQRPFNL
jgi:hypothetical protein